MAHLVVSHVMPAGQGVNGRASSYCSVLAAPVVGTAIAGESSAIMKSHVPTIIAQTRVEEQSSERYR